MVTKHFFKILFIFMLMIVIGIAGIILVSNFDDTSTEVEAFPKLKPK
jgi:hypothetical protein